MGTGTPCVKLAKEPTGASPGRCISTKKRHEAQYPNQANAGNMKRRGHTRTGAHYTTDILTSVKGKVKCYCKKMKISLPEFMQPSQRAPILR